MVLRMKGDTEMAKVVVIGIEGETGLWLVDLAAGTAAPLDAPSGGALGNANDLRKAGASVVKNVNLAVAVSSADAVSSGYLDG